MAMIESVLIRCRGDKSKAARSIGWNRPKLYRRMRRFSIPGDFGRPPGGRSAPIT
jgi:DNA-binding NtrC family response regulator